MEAKVLFKEKELVETEITELADAHCHLDLVQDQSEIKRAMAGGVRTMITNGVDTKSNVRSMELTDNRRIFAALGIDPEHAGISDEELEFNLKMIKGNSRKIVAVGEIGLDYKKAVSFELVAKQKTVFERLLELADSVNLPVCVHSRNAMDDVLSTIREKGNKKVHIHFFEGNAQQAKEIERMGYLVSVPPIESEKRIRAIKEMAIDNIMAESDSPIVGSSPLAVKRSIEIIAAAKGLSFESAAEVVTLNTKKFFNTPSMSGLIRS
jgi:TatD DNase family protein